MVEVKVLNCKGNSYILITTTLSYKTMVMVMVSMVMGEYVVSLVRSERELSHILVNERMCILAIAAIMHFRLVFDLNSNIFPRARRNAG